jgi:pimeloyl-ACP methyl ester carboxylesterase
MKAKTQALRMDRSGGIAPFSAGGLHPLSRRPLILLIHGYNNDDYEAANSFFRMRCNLDNVLNFTGLDEARRKEIQSTIWEFYWPGYQPLTLLNPEAGPRRRYEPVISVPSYSLEVIKARTWVPSGLFDYLLQIQPSEVFFIAHSLGCRVVLETVRKLLESLRTCSVVTGFLLMAGAVPIDLLAETGSLGPSARAPRRRYCLYSWRDMALMLAFPPGQLLSGEAAWYGAPVAAGLTGRPAPLWSLRVNTRLGHHDYWSRGLFAQKTALSELFAGIFQIAVKRDLYLIDTCESSSALPYSILPERHLAFSTLPGANWLQDLYSPS